MNIFTFLFSTSSEADFYSNSASLRSQESIKNLIIELRGRILGRFRVPRCLQDPILESKVLPETSSRPYLGAQTSLQDAFKTLF